MRYQFWSAASFAALSVVPGVHAQAQDTAPLCVAPKSSSTNGRGRPAQVAAPKSRDPLQRQIQSADTLRSQGRDAEAEGIYRRLMHVQDEKRQVARRARLRLAQYALARSDYDEAQALARSSLGPNANAAIRQQASYILRRIEYERGRDEASAALKAMDDSRRAGAAPEGLLAGYGRLLELPCPYPPDFRVRTYERLSEVRGASGDFAGAHRDLDLADKTIPTQMPDHGLLLRQRLAQDRADLRADELIFRAETMAGSNPTQAKALYVDFLKNPGQPSPSSGKLLRVHLKLADIEADAGDFAAARAQVEAASQFVAVGDEHGRDQLVQYRIDIDAIETYAGSDAARSSDPAMQRTFLQRILAMSPPPSASLILRTHLRLADSFARDRQFDRARSELDIAGQAFASDPSAIARIATVRQDIAQREIDVHTADRLDALRLSRGRSPRSAIAGMRELQNINPPASPKVKDNVRLTLADTLRRERYFNDARSLLAFPAAAPDDEGVIRRTADLQQQLDRDTPSQSLHGRVSIGTYYDTNAPTLVSELRTDQNDTGYPVDRKFSDGVLELRGHLTHTMKLNGNYDYWRTDLDGARTVQFDLTKLDRTMAGIATGPVFNLPGQRLLLSVAGRFNWEQRGGNFLRDYYGLDIGIERKFSDVVTGQVDLSALHNKDTRSGLDGDYYDMAMGAAIGLGGQSRIIPEVGFQIRNLDDDTYDSKRYSIRLGYDARWGTPALEYGVALRPRMQWIEYDEPREAGDRHDTKFDVTAQIFARFDQQYRVTLEYRHINTNSNIAGSDRLPDDRVGVSIAYEF